MGLKKKKAAASHTDTLIGEETVIEGKIITKASLRIDGKVVGDIESEGDISIGQNGSVHSKVTARSVVNAGEIHGSVHAKDSLIITPTGKVYGDISVQSLQIADGGIFEGTSKMNVQKLQKLEKKTAAG